jgi:hypothetical protein
MEKTPAEQLSEAAIEGNIDKVRAALDRGADPNGPGIGTEEPAFINSVVNQDPEMIRLFLERGANANMTTRTGLHRC